MNMWHVLCFMKKLHFYSYLEGKHINKNNVRTVYFRVKFSSDSASSKIFYSQLHHDYLITSTSTCIVPLPGQVPVDHDVWVHCNLYISKTMSLLLISNITYYLWRI